MSVPFARRIAGSNPAAFASPKLRHTITSKRNLRYSSLSSSSTPPAKQASIKNARSQRPAFAHVIPPRGQREYATSSNMAALNAIKSNCRKVMCIGRNYADHIKELNNQRPQQPFFFLKPPTSILLPDAGPVLRPAGTTLHYEVELGLVIGKTLRDGEARDEAAWLDAIEQYLLCIDMTARNVQDEAKRKGLPWSIAKGFDTFLPVAGPIAKTAIPDPHNVELWLRVNGELRQQDNTELMLFRIARQLRDISQVMTLEKGDVVLTGTPKGVGAVVTGDLLEAGLRVDGKEIEEARIRVPVQDREGSYEFSET